jgi:hypothetical protein
MAKFRVIRVLEYTYDTAERMVEDRKHWFVKDITGPQIGGMSIKSSVMVPEIIEDEPLPDNEMGLDAIR